MRELWHYGNCFVAELSNGHFLLIDTGKKEDGPYLIDFLRNQSPDDHPVIDGIFVSHCHRDHAGFFRYLIENPCMADAVTVNGVYFNEPKDSAKAMNPYSFQIAAAIREASLILKTENNSTTKVYRPQTGQKYYFSGAVAEVLLAQEQVPRETYARDVNDSSTRLMFRSGNQKVLFPETGIRDVSGLSVPFMIEGICNLLRCHSCIMDLTPGMTFLSLYLYRQCFAL